MHLSLFNKITDVAPSKFAFARSYGWNIQSLGIKRTPSKIRKKTPTDSNFERKMLKEKPCDLAETCPQRVMHKYRATEIMLSFGHVLQSALCRKSCKCLINLHC